MGASRLVALLGLVAAAHAPPEGLYFRNVRVFDGVRSTESVFVLVRSGKIAAVERADSAPAGVRVIEGAGRTLLPALIDAHTHIRSRLDLEKSLVFGVGTDLSLNMDPDLSRALKREQEEGGADDRADIFSAGVAATAPGGHGTEFGFPVPTLTRPEEAQGWVDDRIADGADFIKIMYEAGGENGHVVRPSIDRPTLTALVAAAHARGKLALVHVHTEQQALDAVASGADGLAHVYLFGGPEVDGAFVPRVVERRMFVIPTLTALESVCGLGPGRRVAADPDLAAFLLPPDRAMLDADLGKAPAAECDRPRHVVSLLAAAGVPLLAGTDEPKPGVLAGVSLHGELEALVAAGLSPAQALAAATAEPARVFGLTDRGWLAAGLRADLLLVEGDPTRDIKATRRIVGVWKAGKELRREAWPKRARAVMKP